MNSLMHRLQRSTQKGGFTIPELSIVIAVLAILLAASIIAYGSWRKQVATAETQSDLSNLIASMESARNFGTGYPTALPTDFDSSSNVTLTYVNGDEDSFCVESTSTLYSDVRYFAQVENGTGEVLRGTCLGGIEYDSKYTAFVYDLNAPGCVGTTVQLPITQPTSASGSKIIWGDGLESTLSGANQIHTFPAKGEYTVLYEGPITTISTGSVAPDARGCLTKLTQWADNVTPTRFSVSQSTNFEYAAEPPSSVTSMSYAFENNVVFNQPIGNWDMSNVTNIQSMFAGASSFNQPINNWDTSSVTGLWNTFNGAAAFNQPLNNWDVGNVTGFALMFAHTDSFNQNINNWDMSSATDLSSMFRDAVAFNQPLNNWNVSNVTDLNAMFTDTVAFNQNIDSWNVSKVTNFNHVFANAQVFNQPLNSWDVSAGTTFIQMFRDTDAFNQPIGSWDISNATSIDEIFADTVVFNQNINSWDVSGLTNFFRLFRNAQAFNQPLNNWNTSSVTRMEQMFQFNFVMNQDISMWNVSNVYDVSNATKRGGAFAENTPSWPNNYLPTFPQ